MLGFQRKVLVGKRKLTKSPACRSLFGPVDHDDVNKTLQREIRRINEDNTEKWNFDFVKEEPLPGRFSWDGPMEGSVPEAYRMPQFTHIGIRLLSLKHSALRALNSTIEEECRTEITTATPSSTGSDCDCLPEKADFGPDEERTPPQQLASSRIIGHKRKQTHMTDFFQTKKLCTTGGKLC